MYIRWMADNMWLFVPLQQKLKELLVSIPQYPFQEGMNMSAGDVNYNSLMAAQALKSLQYLTDNAAVPTD